MSKFLKLIKNEKGATAIEYGLIAALIAVAAIGAMQGIGNKLNTTFNNVSNHLGRNRALHRAGDLLHHFQEVAARFVDQRRVGRDAVEQARVGEFADFGDFSGVGEEFHRICVCPGFREWAGISRWGKARHPIRRRHGRDRSRAG